MSDAAALVVLIGAVVSAVSVIGGAARWLLWPRLIASIRADIAPMRAQVAETHKQVTENHHANENPTVLDRIDDVHQEVTKVRDDLNNSILLAAKAQADMWRAIEAVANGTPPSDD